MRGVEGNETPFIDQINLRKRQLYTGNEKLCNATLMSFIDILWLQ